MDPLVLRTARRFLASQVRILVDVPATLEARAKYSSPEAIIATFDQSISLYRLFDEGEMARILTTGRITGGQYSARMEREHGASWGANITDVIEWGNKLRGKRLGHDLFLAKLDATGMRFFHGLPEIPEIDPNGPSEQPAMMNRARIYTGMGASVMGVGLGDVDLYAVHENDQIEKISVAEARERLARRPKKDVDLREVHEQLYLGTILGVEVMVHLEKGHWNVYAIRDQDRTQFVSGVSSKDDAIELAKMGIHMRPGNPVHMDAGVLEVKRRHEKHFEQDDDPAKIRGAFALKPKDRLTVLKGSSALGIRAYTTLTVADVWQTKGERSVNVKLLVGDKPVRLYASHPNRLADEEIALLDARGSRVIVERKRR